MCAHFINIPQDELESIIADLQERNIIRDCGFMTA